MRWDDAKSSIRMVHEAALRPELWPDALRQISRTCNSTTAIVQMVGPDGYNILVGRGAEGAVQDYLQSEWVQRNSRITRGLALTRAGFPGLITEQHMFTPEELAADPFEQEFAPLHDMEAEAGMVVAAHGQAQFILTMPRGARAGPYSGSELEQMNRLAGSLREACSLALRLRMSAAVDMLDTMCAAGEALALLAPGGRLLHMTPAFERLLGERLCVRGGNVHAVAPADDAALQELVARAAAGPSAGPPKSIVIKRENSLPLVARAMPVVGSARDLFGLARVILTVDDAGAIESGADAALLRSAFGLTGAEARLAVRLGEGDDLRRAAGAVGVSFETARTRLKVIFRKTGVNRQSQLATLVNRLPR